MGLFNEYSSATKTDSSSTQGIPGPQGIGYKLDANGNFDIENKKLTNVKNGDKNNDVMNKSQIESYVGEKTVYIENVNPGQVVNNKAVIYSNTGSVHSNALYLKDRYGQETIFHNEDQDDNQIRLYIPNLKNNDSFGGRLKSSIMVSSIDQTIEGKKIFHDIEVPTPTINGHASNKAYVDNEISKISDASDNSNYVKKTGDTMTGSLIVQKDDYPIQGDLNKVINYESQREIFVSRWETRQMKTSIDMNGHTIDNLPAPKNNDQAISKGYGDINYLNRLNGGQIGGNIDMRGNTIRYLGLEKALDSAARVNELNQKADKTELNDYMMLDGSKTMTGKLNMGGNRITGLTQTPYYNGEATNKMYVDDKVNSKADSNDLNKYLKLDGSKAMTSDLNMNNHIITNVKTPLNDSDATNKKYVNDEISKSNIQPTHIPNNVFKYLMDDVNEWTTEYNVEVENFIDLNEIAHSWNKRVLSITPIKDGKNYRFRLGLQMGSLITNQAYSIVVEMYNRDFVTWERQETYIEGIGIWLKSHNTIKYQHHYGNNNTLYYSKTSIKFNKTSFSGSLTQIYFTIHFDDNGGDLNTYANKFENQIYILAYGALGDINIINPMIYDKHEAFVLNKTEMKMLIPLDMNQKAIKNIGNLSWEGTVPIYGTVHRSKYFVISNIILNFTNIHLSYIKLHGTLATRGKLDALKIIIDGANEVKYPFRFDHTSSIAKIIINRFFNKINNIQLQTIAGVGFQISYNMFR